MLCSGKGKPVTLVSTDVEGSTELWEWDTHSMVDAFSLHDRILRSQLARHYGYEVRLTLPSPQPAMRTASGVLKIHTMQR